MASPSEYRTPEARALKKHTGQLTRAIQEADLPVLAIGFFSEDMISTELMENVSNPATAAKAVRCSRLLVAVMAHLEDHPDKFECVLEIFNQEPTHATIADRIEKACEAAKAAAPASTHPAAAAAAAAAVPPALSPTLGKYSAHLKKLYRRTKHPFNSKWPPTPCKEIVKLAAVKKRKRKTREKEVSFMRTNSLEEYIKEEELVPIEIDEILKSGEDDSLPTCVIVQGAPGIGKSTFAWNLSQKWAEGSLYQEYDLVVLLPMRDPRVREAKTLSDLINYHDNKAVAQEILEKGGKGVLLLLEGFDELPATCLEEGSVFMDLFRGILLPDATILTTTRPWAAEKLKKRCAEQISQEVEILGFENDNIVHYASQSFEDKNDQEEFSQYVLSHPLLETVMYIPLNAAIVVQVYKQRKSSAQPPPQTMTQLYKSLIQGLVLRYLQDDPKYQELNLSSLEELPSPLSEQFCKLCELAHSAFRKDSVKMIFSESELPLDSLGILRTTTDLSADIGSVLLHSFPHITVQEFLAAYHISLLSLDKQATFVFEHQSLPQFQVILGFLFGLSKHIHAFLPYLSPLSFDVNTNIQCFHWLYEAQSPELCAAYLGSNTISFSCSNWSSFDIFIMSYCMAYSNCEWMLSVCNLPSSIAVFQPPVDIAMYFQGSMQFLLVQSSDPMFSKQGFCGFLSLPTRLFAGIERLHLYECLCDQSCEQLTKLVKFGSLPNLSALLIDHCDAENIANLFEALHRANTPLQKLQLTSLEITDSTATELSKLLYTSSTCSHFLLQSVTFTEDQNLPMLLSAVARPESLRSLSLYLVQLSRTDVEFLSAVLSQNNTLTKLALIDCSIDDEGAYDLASALEVNNTLKALWFHNNITKNGAQAFADMLKTNSTLEELYIFDTSIRIHGAIKLITALEENQSLFRLELHENCHPPELPEVDRVKFNDRPSHTFQ